MKQRRTSVKDRINLINKKGDGDEILLKTFGSSNSNKTESTTDSEDNTTNESTDSEDTTTNTIEALSPPSLPLSTSPSQNVSTNDRKTSNQVQEQIVRLNTLSNQKKLEYNAIKQSANVEIAKLQDHIRKNSKQLTQYIQIKPEERQPDQIESVDRIRLEQGKMRADVRVQLNRQVSSAKERINTLLKEQEALHQAWEEYTK